MSNKFRMPGYPVYDYPNNDDEIVNLLMMEFNRHHGSPTMLKTVAEYLGWELSDDEHLRLNNLLKNNPDMVVIPFGYHDGFKTTDENYLKSKEHGSYIKWKQVQKIKSMTYDEICDLVLLELEGHSGPIEDILNKHGIDQSLSIGIGSSLEQKGWVGLTKQGAYMEAAGREQVGRIKVDGFGKSSGALAIYKIYHHVDNSIHTTTFNGPVSGPVAVGNTAHVDQSSLEAHLPAETPKPKTSNIIIKSIKFIINHSTALIIGILGSLAASYIWVKFLSKYFF